MQKPTAVFELVSNYNTYVDISGMGVPAVADGRSLPTTGSNSTIECGGSLISHTGQGVTVVN